MLLQSLYAQNRTVRCYQLVLLVLARVARTTRHFSLLFLEHIQLEYDVIQSANSGATIQTECSIRYKIELARLFCVCVIFIHFGKSHFTKPQAGT